MQKIISTTEKETRDTAVRIALGLSGGSVIALEGDLGVGKTVFAKGVADALGVEEEITSPTFVLLRSYRGDSMVLHHIDAYRLGGSEEAYEAGLDEVIGASGAITLIEWPSIVSELVPKGAVRVEITRIDDETREITVR